MFGIGPAHIRSLCENAWEGGRAYTPSQVGDMTIDQIYMLLCDRKVLRSSGRMRAVAASPHAVVGNTDENGMLSGVAKDGTKIKAKIMGKSKARRLMEEEEQRAREEAERQQAQKKPVRRRRNGH